MLLRPQDPCMDQLCKLVGYNLPLNICKFKSFRAYECSFSLIIFFLHETKLKKLNKDENLAQRQSNKQ